MFHDEVRELLFRALHEAVLERLGRRVERARLRVLCPRRREQGEKQQQDEQTARHAMIYPTAD